MSSSVLGYAVYKGKNWIMVSDVQYYLIVFRTRGDLFQRHYHHSFYTIIPWSETEVAVEVLIFQHLP